jgi:hypothetical protein
MAPVQSLGPLKTARGTSNENGMAPLRHSKS